MFQPIDNYPPGTFRKMKSPFISIVLASLSAVYGCTDEVMTYTTTADKKQLFETESVRSSRLDRTISDIISFDESTTHQSIDGFGAAMTWASCYNIKKMPSEQRTAFLKELFDKQSGLGIGLVRVSIGASDFNLEEYTWCDTPGIEHFAMHPSDREVVIPILKEIYAINPDIKIIASPWSCPRWMKQFSIDDGSDYYSWTAGSLKKEYYDDYALYFVKWIQTMEQEGFDIYAVTIQNEPLNPGNSMSLYMTWEEQRDFLKTALGPAFEKAGIDTKVLLFDHNYNYDGIPSQQDYPLHIFRDPDASKFAAGSAWHNYNGTVSELDHITCEAPDKEIYFTEASIGTWNYEFSKCLLEDFDQIFMQTLSRGGKGVTLWNMVLDENRWPFSPQKGSCKSCYGVATMNSGSGDIIDRTSHYYDIAHTSKVVKPGAERIDVNGSMPEGIDIQAYLNEDASYGILILNRNKAGKSLKISKRGRYIECFSPAESIVSVTW